MSKLYDRAMAIQEDADERFKRAPDWLEPNGSSYWNDPERVARWRAIDFLACLIAGRAVIESSAVESAYRLAETADRRGNLRAYAKAVAARCAMQRAVWVEAYGRYMRKHGGDEFQLNRK